MKPEGGWTKETLNVLLAESDRAVERALVVLYHRQTGDEQRTRTTKHHNLQGFCSWDAEVFTSFAEQVLAGKTLSPKQLEICRRVDKLGRSRIGKYHRQLLEAVNAKAGVVEQMTLGV